VFNTIWYINKYLKTSYICGQPMSNLICLSPNELNTRVRNEKKVIYNEQLYHRLQKHPVYLSGDCQSLIWNPTQNLLNPDSIHIPTWVPIVNQELHQSEHHIYISHWIWYSLVVGGLGSMLKDVGSILHYFFKKNLYIIEIEN
jgi:hypothetical protein